MTSRVSSDSGYLGSTSGMLQNEDDAATTKHHFLGWSDQNCDSLEVIEATVASQATVRYLSPEVPETTAGLRPGPETTDGLLSIHASPQQIKCLLFLLKCLL